MHRQSTSNQHTTIFFHDFWSSRPQECWTGVSGAKFDAEADFDVCGALAPQNPREKVKIHIWLQM